MRCPNCGSDDTISQTTQLFVVTLSSFGLILPSFLIPFLGILFAGGLFIFGIITGIGWIINLFRSDVDYHCNNCGRNF